MKIDASGNPYAGDHILLDMWGASHLTCPLKLEEALTSAAVVAGATILNANFHQFGVNGGVSGALILAESHISVHTWPERDFCAIDVFMCGNAKPSSAVMLIRSTLQPNYFVVSEIKRGCYQERRPCDRGEEDDHEIEVARARASGESTIT